MKCAAQALPYMYVVEHFARCPQQVAHDATLAGSGARLFAPDVNFLATQVPPPAPLFADACCQTDVLWRASTFSVLVGVKVPKLSAYCQHVCGLPAFEMHRLL